MTHSNVFAAYFSRAVTTTQHQARSQVKTSRLHRFASQPLPHARGRASRNFTSSSHSQLSEHVRVPGPVVGCGSVVVDIFQSIQRFPERGAKGYVNRCAPRPRRSAGGVCLNHLAWAAALVHTPVALLARIGPEDRDPDAALLFDAMRTRHVDTQYVLSASDHRTPTSHVYTDSDSRYGQNAREGGSGSHGPERTIIMDPASTSGITAHLVDERWTDAITHASVVSTEVSQVPLAGAARVLELGREAKAFTVLDFDVPPETACRDDDAGLGTRDELLRLLSLADVIKASYSVALALCSFLGPSGLYSSSMSVETVARVLMDIFPGRPSLLVVTNGKSPAVAITDRGLEISSCFRPASGIRTPAMDVTGSGDAFIGGCLAWIYHNQCVPDDREGLHQMLKVASICGTACAQIMHSALPPPYSTSFARHLALQEPGMAQFIEQAESSALQQQLISR